jgi:ribosomal protein S27AE
MRCSKCGREAFLLSTAEQWRIERWVHTERFCCGSCGTMYIQENGRTCELPVKNLESFVLSLVVLSLVFCSCEFSASTV